MFWFTQEPSSGSYHQCLAKNYKYCSTVRVLVDAVSVMAAYLTWCACVWFTVHRGTVPLCAVNRTHAHQVRYAAITLTASTMTCTVE